MRRRQTTPEPAKATAKRCPGCGARNLPSALRCTICGETFASAVEVSQLWGAIGGDAPPDEPLIDLYASADTPGVFRAGAAQATAGTQRTEQASDRRPALGATVDPWASGSGTLATMPGKPESGAFTPPGTAAATTRDRGSRLRTALLTILLILVVGGAAAWFAGRPVVSRLIADNVGGAIDDRLGGVAALPVDDQGRITIVERDITRALRADAAAYEPVSSPAVSLSRHGVRVVFTVYGVESALTATLAVEQGRVVLVDPVLDGPARRLVDLDRTVAAAEEPIADLFARSGVRPVAVKTSDDTLVITTEPIAG